MHAVTSNLKVKQSGHEMNNAAGKTVYPLHFVFCFKKKEKKYVNLKNDEIMR